MKSLVRWMWVGILLILLVEFPRGATPPPYQSTITSPIVYFHGATYVRNLLDLWHRVAHLAPGLDISQTKSLLQTVEGAMQSSLPLLGIAFLLVSVCGVLKGLFDGLASTQPTVWSATSQGIQWLIESLPDFFVIIVLVMVSFAAMKHGVQISFVGSHHFLTGTLVPAVLISLIPMMYMARMVRLTVADQIGQLYISTAYSKGLGRWSVIFRHILPNCYGTIVQSIPPVVALLFSNLVMVEYLLYRPGIVSTLFWAMGNKGDDYIYHPVGIHPKITYYAYDPQLVFASLVACVSLFLICKGLSGLVLTALGHRGQTNPYTAPFLDRRQRRGWPWQTQVGLAILLLLVVLGGLASHLPIVSPSAVDDVHYGATLSSAPFAPSWQHPFGTDVLGHDMLSQTIHGILPTLQLVVLPAVALVVISLGLALLTTIWNVPGLAFVISVWNGMFLFIPGVIAALLILEIPDVYWLGAHQTGAYIRWNGIHTFVYLGVLCLIELGRVVAALQTTIRTTEEKEYMAAAAISGNTRFSKLVLHHWKPLWHTLLEQLAVCTSRLLFLIATLGFFMMPVAQQFHLVMDWTVPVWALEPSTLDWSGLISQNARDFMTAPWVLIGPAAFVAITVIALNLWIAGMGRSSQTMAKSRATHLYGAPFWLIAFWRRKGADRNLRVGESHVKRPEVP